MRCASCGEPHLTGGARCDSCGQSVRSVAELEAAFKEAPPVVSGRLRVGQPFGSRYVVQSLLGVGGMGAVYRARDKELEIDVALKVLRSAPTNLASAVDARRRLKAELLLARKISHKNVIRIHDIGEVDSIMFISMALVEGQNLAVRLEAGALEPAQAIRYARQLASGLAAAHAAGVIHRDLKPSNVMIGEDDQAILMDFG